MKKILALVLCVCLSAFGFAACGTDDMRGETSASSTTQRTTGTTTTMTTPLASSPTVTSTTSATSGGIISGVSSFLSGLVSDATEPIGTGDGTNSSDGSDASGVSDMPRNRMHSEAESDRKHGSVS